VQKNIISLFPSLPFEKTPNQALRITELLIEIGAETQQSFETHEVRLYLLLLDAQRLKILQTRRDISQLRVTPNKPTLPNLANK